jgi:hypothetical protein
VNALCQLNDVLIGRLNPSNKVGERLIEATVGVLHQRSCACVRMIEIVVGMTLDAIEAGALRAGFRSRGMALYADGPVGKKDMLIVSP